jgi:putative cardiolipin synthase
LEANLIVGEGHFLQDDPVEIDGKPFRLSDMLAYVAGPSMSELLVSSPYFIPDNTFLQELASDVDRGVAVKVLTGSLGSNNHTAAHSHYKKYRKRILDTGSELYEFHHEPSPMLRDLADVPPIEGEFISLHSKVIVADRRISFIGSLNLDPRAMVINTENGLLIESEVLAAQLVAIFETLIARENAWQVFADERGKLRWESTDGIVTRQPARTGGQRVSEFFLRLLPLEKQL